MMKNIQLDRVESKQPPIYLQMQTVHTFDLLLIPKPAQVGSRLAALGHAGQSDVVPLHGRLCQAIDLWLLRDT